MLVLPFILNKIHIVHFYLPFFVWLLLLSMLLLLPLLLNLNIFCRVSRNAATQISTKEYNEVAEPQETKSPNAMQPLPEDVCSMPMLALNFISFY